MRVQSGPTRNRLYGALAAALILAALPAAGGPLIAPGQKLQLIRTRHFDIIFPERSKPSALRLARVAEPVYAEVAARLDSRLPARVPVVITPDIGTFNGFMNPVPYFHIVLYDTPLPLSWTAFRDNFRGLFLHELTHAVSLQVKAPWAGFLSGIFGSWVAPALLNAPMFMVEGVTVSFESAEGEGGRANDPLVRQRIRQDILENRFKSPLEAEGVYDEYPGGSIYYEYGGLFSAWIQETRGMEAYARLWKEMGTIILPGSLDPYEWGFFRAFEKVYGLSFRAAWADFRNSLTILGVAQPPELLVGSAPSSIKCLAAGGGFLYWVDARASRAWRMELATGTREAIFDADASTLISDASADGTRLLVQRSISLSDGRDRVETAVYDLAARRFLPAAASGLREARFFRDGMVGIKARLHNADLVYSAPEGEKVLLRGHEELMFASPAPMADGRIALIVAVAGRRGIGLLDADSLGLSMVRPGPGADGDGAGVLDYARSLSAAGDRLWFNHDSDDRMYKLGCLEGDRLRLETVDWSGGVLLPLEAGSRVYYVARLSGGEAICRYPGEAPSLGPRVLDWKSENLMAPDEESGGEGQIAATAPETAPEILPYRPLAYANPFNTWFLYPDLGTMDRSFRFLADFLFADPIGENTAILSSGYDSLFPFAEAGLFWTNRALPFGLELELGDHLVYGAAARPERQSSASVQATLPLPLYPTPRGFELGLGASVLERAAGTGTDPYAWAYGAPAFIASGWLGYLGRLPGVVRNSSRGLDLVTWHDLAFRPVAYKTEARLTLATDVLPLRLDVWGAWANEAMLSLDSSSAVFAADRRPPYFEYQGLRTGREQVLAEGDASLRLADQAIHSGILGLYLNRLLADVGYRGAWFGEEYLQSCYARLSIDLAAGAGAAGALGLRAYAEGFARLSDGLGSDSLGWRLGIAAGMQP